MSAGPTREYLDPVRFLTNASTGRLGLALAAAAAGRGHRVTLVHGPVAPELLRDLPPEVCRVAVTTAAEMLTALEARFPAAEVLFMVAAVADFRPERVSVAKLRRRAGPVLFRFHPTEDILKRLGARKTRQFLVGFTLETEPGLQEGRRKLVEKKLDLLVANTPRNLGDVAAAVTLLRPDGETETWPPLPKPELAARLVRLVEEEAGRG